MRCFFYLIAGVICFSPGSLSATTIVPYANLGEATANSESVVLARAVSYVETAVGDKVFHDTQFEVLDPVKGGLIPGETFSVRAMSYRIGDFDFNIAGDFNATLGKRYLLFLHQKGAVWTPVMLSYYAFEQIMIGSDEFLAPLGEAAPQP